MSESIARCRSCAKPIWWQVNKSGKRQPMDYDMTQNQPTTMPHHATCPQALRWKAERSSAVRDDPETLPWWYR